MVLFAKCNQNWFMGMGRAIGLLPCGKMINLRQVMVVTAVNNITLQLPWLQMIILCEICAEVNKQLSIENVMQHCVFFVRYKPRLKNELSKKHVIRPSSIRLQHSDG
jgi:hypothetical protein